MSRTCRECGNTLAEQEAFCNICGTLSQASRLEGQLDHWKVPEKIELLRSKISAFDKTRVHILLSVLAGLLVALPMASNILKGSQSEESVSTLIFRVCGQLLAAMIFASFPIGYMVHGRWPLFSRIDSHLGGPSSLSRVLVYSLTIQLFVLVSSAELPGVGELMSWIVGWLFGSLIWFFPVGFFLTGAVPFAGPLQLILGEYLSARRRLILSVLLTLPWWSEVTDIRQLLAILALNFYLMGHATNWRLIWRMGLALELPDLHDRVTMIKERIRERMDQLGLDSLHISEIDLARTDLFSAGQSSVAQGYQLSFTLDRARVTLFVQDFGRDLFTRTVVHCDISGRRLWLMIGYVISFLDTLAIRWFGSSFLRYASQIRATMTPASRLRDHSYESDPIGTFFANLFGLLEMLPDRDVNDIFALHGAIQHSLVDALKEAMKSKGLDDEIEAIIDRQLMAESGGTGGPTGASSLGARQGLLSGKLA